MTEKISTFQQALDVVEALKPEEQEILVDIVSRRLSQQRRSELITEVAQAKSDYEQGQIRRGSVADLMRELDE
ncbi:MAG: hypothetical protein PUP92_37005 [Rhizonema sp. PD38]|jgi:hypothetical protein|nr:hypothetical protein [Rhizonema sp. NSF051]MDF5733431.1 hypothetical protein [Rhizonema sp. PD38]